MSKPARHFPWEDDEKEQSHKNMSYQWIPSLQNCAISVLTMDQEARRTRRWNAEREKQRELQQQLGTLRSLRGWRARKQRQELCRIGMDNNIEVTKGKRLRVQILVPNEHSNDNDQDPSNTTHSLVPSQAFPWKDNSNNNNNTRQHLYNPVRLVMTFFLRLVPILCYYSNIKGRLLDYQECRRARKWDQEVKRYRPLQQQLLQLQIIRAKRMATEERYGLKQPAPSKMHMISMMKLVDDGKFPWREGG